MPKKAAALAAYQVKRLQAPGLHAVGGVAGLQLYIKPSGARSWVLRKVTGQRRRDFGLGGYPDVTLAQARERARAASDLIRAGKDPVAERQAAQARLAAEDAKRLTFDQAASRCWRVKSKAFKNAKHAAQWKRTLDTYASPRIGHLRVSAIELAHVLNVLEPIWETKTETATRLRQRMEAVLAWATVSGFRSGDNPARWSGNLDQVLPKPSKVKTVKHHAALPWQAMGAFMAALHTREGLAARALEFAVLTAARSGEVRLATWEEIDFEAKRWTLPAERMKAGKAHTVPLSEAAVGVLNALPRRADSPYLFPAPRGGALSDMALSALTRRLGVEAVPHGFRSSFKDWCRSATAYPDEVSELALAHVGSDATRAAYARDGLFAKRTRLMRDWARFCATVSATEVTPLRARA